MKFIKIKDVKSPVKSNYSDSGIDFFIPNSVEKISIRPQQSVLIPLGIKIILPAYTDLTFFNRSSVASKKGLLVGACVVDNGYRGELFLNLWNASSEVQEIFPGEKIVQGILRRVEPDFPIEIEQEEYEDEKNITDRMEGGFGSTN